MLFQISQYYENVKLPSRQRKTISLNVIAHHLKRRLHSFLVHPDYATLYRGNTRVNQHYNKDSLNDILTVYIRKTILHTRNTPGGSLTGIT